MVCLELFSLKDTRSAQHIEAYYISMSYYRKIPYPVMSRELKESFIDAASHFGIKKDTK